VTSGKIKLEFIEKKFNKELSEQIIDKLYNLDWIINSVKEKAKLDSEGYKINLIPTVKKTSSNLKRKADLNDITLDQFYTKRKKLMLSPGQELKKEDFFPIQEKKHEESDNEEKVEMATQATTTTFDDTNSLNINNIDSTTATNSKGVLRRGLNDRMKIFLSQESIDEFDEKKGDANVGSKSNKELFDDIWQNIGKLKREGKDDEIFSQKSYSDNSDSENKSVISTTDSISVSSTQSSFKKFYPDKSKFAFNNTSKINLNEHITTELEKILDFHQNEGNVFESLAYRKAIAQLKNTNEKITSCDQLKTYKYLGKSIGQKIKEILLTGKLGKSEYLKDDERNKTLKLLTEVWGIGMGIANKLYRKGIKTIEDLRKNESLLNKNQKVGLKYYEEIKDRIPRAECEEVLAIAKEELFTILPEDLLEVQLCGSYRRGKATCGDMDILITRNDDGGIDGILQTLVDKLMSRGLITDILSLSFSTAGRNQFMGVSQLEGKPHRRLDIKIYQRQYYPFALLYFTGSAYFNRSMRLFASKVGYNLSDLGLYKVYGYRKTKVPTGVSIKCNSEEEIFKALGLDYKAPNERDI
jgi:DNA polymerase/3'-5' exonuclease PolX